MKRLFLTIFVIFSLSGATNAESNSESRVFHVFKSILEKSLILEERKKDSGKLVPKDFWAIDPAAVIKAYARSSLPVAGACALL